MTEIQVIESEGNKRLRFTIKDSGVGIQNTAKLGVLF